MSEETLSEFIEELIKRGEPVPRDLIEKYKGKDVPPSELAGSMLARAALKGPDAPSSALQNSERRVSEAAEKAHGRESQPAPHARTSLGARVLRAALRLLRLRNK